MTPFWWGVALVGGLVGLGVVFFVWATAAGHGTGDLHPENDAQLRAAARQLIADLDEKRDGGQS